FEKGSFRWAPEVPRFSSRRRSRFQGARALSAPPLFCYGVAFQEPETLEQVARWRAEPAIAATGPNRLGAATPGAVALALAGRSSLRRQASRSYSHAMVVKFARTRGPRALEAGVRS